MELLTEREAREILCKVNLPASSNKVTLLAVNAKSTRQEIILDPDHEYRPIAAAIEIQRFWRGYWTRCQVLDKFQPAITNESQPDEFSYKISDPTLSKSFSSSFHSPGSLNFLSKGSSPSSGNETQDSQKSLRSNSKLKNAYKKWLEENEQISFEEYCNLVSQSLWQEQDSRDIPGDRPSTMIEDYDASGRTSRNYSPFLGVKCDSPERLGGGRLSARSVQFKTVPSKRFDSSTPDVLTRNDAAKILQKAWRRHVDVQVFQYYRDLISFKFRGDPSLLLRCINPREAELLDSASGTYLKFRLAGTNFPPNIYYKIFTHRTVIDMCANSPKDYTKAAVKQLVARQCHNNNHPVSWEGEKDGWYERWENNGWRLVSDRILKRIDEDAVVYDSAQKKITFKHSKLLRRQDVEKKRRKKENRMDEENVS